LADVTVSFTGEGAEEAAQKFYTWIVDGGLSDGILDECSGDSYELDLGEWDNVAKTMTFTGTARDA